MSDEPKAGEQKYRVVKKRRLIVITAASTVALIGVLFGVMEYFAARSLRQVDLNRLGDLFGAGFSEVVTREAATPIQAGTGGTSATLLADLPPEEIRKRAQTAATYADATTVGLAASEMSARGNLPETSATLISVPSQFRTDAWGHPFCLFRMNDRAVVVSAGPNQGTFPGCDQLTVNAMDVAHQANGLLYRYPSGRLVLVTKAP